MDYSSLPNDPDHPAGTSPWQTSPQITRSSTFNGSELGSEPPSPAKHPQSQDDAAGGAHGGGQDSMEGSAEGFAGSRNQSSLRDSQQDGQGQRGVNGQERGSQQQQKPSQPSRYHGTAQQRQRQNQPKYRLSAKITGIERSGRKDPVLKFDVHTNLPKFRTTQFRDIRRTHSEFQKLANHLISSNPEALVPAVPPEQTSAGLGTEDDDTRVKAMIQRWLNTVFDNDVLMRDDEVIFFIESDSGYSPVMRMKQPATGVRRKVIKQFAPPPDDTPELHAARPIVKLFYLGTMETGQKVDKLVKSRRGLGLAENDFGVKIGAMHVQESHPGLAAAYRKLGRIIQTTGDYHAAQGTAEATTLGDPLNYHSSDAFIVKETLTNRHILLRDLLSAQQATRSKVVATDRVKSSGSIRRDKVDEAIAALDEAKGQEEYLYKKTQRVTANLLKEKRQWFARTAADVRTSIREYVLKEIEAERRTLAILESVRPDIRAIDSSGGLSRLGREAHPQNPRRSSLASSQGPRGDAWSGVPRRGGGGEGGALERSFTAAGLPATVPEEGGDGDGDGVNGDGTAAAAGKGGVKKLVAAGVEDDDDRVDARNAASRLAGSTF